MSPRSGPPPSRSGAAKGGSGPPGFPLVVHLPIPPGPRRSITRRKVEGNLPLPPHRRPARRKERARRLPGDVNRERRCPSSCSTTRSTPTVPQNDTGSNGVDAAWFLSLSLGSLGPSGFTPNPEGVQNQSGTLRAEAAPGLRGRTLRRATN